MTQKNVASSGIFLGIPYTIVSEEKNVVATVGSNQQEIKRVFRNFKDAEMWAKSLITEKRLSLY